MTSRATELDRDTHYTQVRQPRPLVDQGISREQLDIMLANGEKLLDIARRCASCNDVRSLKVFMEPDLTAELLRQQDDHPNPKISATYAVAHMMVDGGGNEDFAMAWMQHFGHTVKDAGEHFLALWNMPNEGLEFEQKRLAMAHLGQATVLLEGKGLSPLAQMPVTGILPTPRVTREIGFYLRAFHPDGVPDVTAMKFEGPEFTESLGGTWCRDAKLFAAVLDAYPPEHVRAGEQMQAAMRQVLQEHPAQRLNAVDFEGLDRWGWPGCGADVWTWSQPGELSCIEALLGRRDKRVVEDLKRLIDAGADVNATFRARVGTLHRAIDIAVENGDSASVGLLLAHGADPQLKAIDKDPKFCRSAADWILGKSDKDLAELQKEAESKSLMASGLPQMKAKADYEGVRSLIQVYLTRQSALEAIGEILDTAPAPGR